MRSVLYLHGFASSPASGKITALRPMLEPCGIDLDTPDLNVPSFERLDFDAMVDEAMRRAAARPPHAIVGSSMGSLVALSALRRGLRVPAVLIAPALGIAQRWQERIPDGDPVMMFNYARNEEAPIHRAFFDQVYTIDVDQEPPPTRVTVLMGREDQSVPFPIVEEIWGQWERSGRLVPSSRFISIDGGDHSLVAHTRTICEAIRDAVDAQI